MAHPTWSRASRGSPRPKHVHVLTWTKGVRPWAPAADRKGNNRPKMAIEQLVAGTATQPIAGHPLRPGSRFAWQSIDHINQDKFHYTFSTGNYCCVRFDVFCKSLLHVLQLSLRVPRRDSIASSLHMLNITSDGASGSQGPAQPCPVLPLSPARIRKTNMLHNWLPAWSCV